MPSSRASRITPGETVEFETLDASSGQLSPNSTAADLAKLDLGRVNPVTGPVFVDGAQPGDALKVTLLSFKPVAAGAGPATSRASACWPTSSPTPGFIIGTMTRASRPRCTGRAVGCR